MADTEELRQMILSFRVSELQVLLGFAGRNKCGRKQELQARALDLLKLRAAPIQMKVKELYKRRFPAKPVSPSHLQSSPIKNQLPPMPHPGMSPVAGLPGHPPPHLHNPLDYSPKHPLATPPNALPIHPDVKLKRLPFYDILGELLKPTSLVPAGNSRFQETYFVFHLTPQQAQDIAMSRDLRSGGKNEYAVQVQLRFCLLETSCEQDDNFPPSICVRVNGKMCPLPNPIPTNKPGVEPKRPSRPVNITALCRLSPTIPNHINVSWASEFGRGYAVAVYLVRRVSATTLLQRLKASGIRNADHTRALIKEKLVHDPDSEIATTSLRVSLMCPLGKMRMQIPCRATTCSHLQCFDASLYLQMNEKKPTWICPVCDKAAPFDKLSIDGLFTDIFKNAPDCNEIQFSEDGSWSPLITTKDPKTIHSTAIRSPIPPSAPAPMKPETKPKTEVIDLTLDSSSDDEDEKLLSQPTVINAGSVNSSNITSCSNGYNNCGPNYSASLNSITNYQTSTSAMSISTVSSSSSSSSSSSTTTTSNNSNNGGASYSIPPGCVSPSIITLDTPPHVSHSSQHDNFSDLEFDELFDLMVRNNPRLPSYPSSESFLDDSVVLEPDSTLDLN